MLVRREVRVEISDFARKHLLRVPRHIAVKLLAWVDGVTEEGIAEMRRVTGYHDEPLRGKRAGQRSIRLSRAYRAIYEERTEGEVEIISVEEVTKHGY